MQLKKCPTCDKYTMKEICSECGIQVVEMGYKFLQIRDAPKDSSQHFLKLRKKK